MRYGSAARRPRNNNNNRGGNNNQRRSFQNKNKVFDSNGPDVRIRGTAYQIVEKYMALAKDSASAGDRVLAESYLQYAEHYQRIINSWEEEDAAYGVANSDVAVNEIAEEDLSLPSSIVGSKQSAAAPQQELAEA
ncbi:MAG TPA: DUF4167 domain-containing protein [Alphaproteobacteria bacterium]|nr:DUF4167 domain-containing protein [Alphaproteobacteria bacterium]